MIDTLNYRVQDFSERKDPSPQAGKGAYRYKKLYSTNLFSLNQNDSISQSFLIREAYEAVDMQMLPAGTYWWQDEEGIVQKIDKL